MQVGIFASHFGSTLQAIIDAYQAGQLAAVPSVVISNNGGSEALKRAERAGIPAFHLSRHTHPNRLADEMLSRLQEHRVDLVVLAGYMKRLEGRVLEHYRGRIVNTHPALLPKFGGQGMYGMHVHEAVIAAGETASGATIHLVDAEYDAGPILRQVRVPVHAGDTPDDLAERVQACEKELLIRTLDDLACGRLALPSR